LAAFNAADSAITIGAILGLCVAFWLFHQTSSTERDRHKRKSPASEKAATERTWAAACCCSRSQTRGFLRTVPEYTLVVPFFARIQLKHSSWLKPKCTKITGRHGRRGRRLDWFLAERVPELSARVTKSLSAKAMYAWMAASPILPVRHETSNRSVATAAAGGAARRLPSICCNGR